MTEYFNFLTLFQDALNGVVIRDLRSNRENITQAVLAVELQKKESIYGFHNNRKLPFLKITMALPRLIAPAKRLLEQGFACPGFGTHGYQSYESDVGFEIRFVHTLLLLSFCQLKIIFHLSRASRPLTVEI